MTSSWDDIDARFGVPVVFAPQGSAVVTNAPQVAARRGEHGLSDASRRLQHLLHEHLHLDAPAHTDGLVTVDLTRNDTWLDHLPIDTRALTDRAATIGIPAVRTPSVTLAWTEFASEVGADAATWAVLRSASKTPPFVLGIEAGILGSRTDDNSLALVRRAHSAVTLHVDDTRPSGARSTAQHNQPPHADPTPSADASLRSAVLLASRALHDTERHGRTRPALVAIEIVAREALRHLERAPVTRTDLPALAAARSILRASLDAVGVSAPVPY